MRLVHALRGSAFLTVWIVLAALILLGTLRYDNFASAYNFGSFLGYNSMFILISVGMCVVIMTGGIDLSVVAVGAVSSVTAALASPMGLVVAVPVGMATGLAVGLVNAGLIVGLRLPPFVATLAAMLGSSGLALTVSDNRAVPVAGPRISPRWG